MISIGVVARQVGIAVGTLRQWEHRYGFPRPQRDAAGRRFFSEEDVTLLHEVSLRVKRGERVGQVIRQLQCRPSALPDNAIQDAVPESLQVLLQALMRNDVADVSERLRALRQGQSLLQFIDRSAAPLTWAVGDAWADGRLPIHAEHLFSALLEQMLSDEIGAAEPSQAPPRLLLTTLPEERHTLGLSMLHAALAEAGINCLRLSSALPVAQIQSAAEAYRPAIVAISASLHYPPRLLLRQLLELRRVLPAEMKLWLGGAGMDKLTRLPEPCRQFRSIPEALDALSPIILDDPLHPDRR